MSFGKGLIYNVYKMLVNHISAFSSLKIIELYTYTHVVNESVNILGTFIDRTLYQCFVQLYFTTQRLCTVKSHRPALLSWIEGST